MSTDYDNARRLGTVTLIGYDYETKVFNYRDDRDGSVWQTQPSKCWGELVPFPRHPSDAHVGDTLPGDNLFLIDSQCQKFVPAEDAHNGKIVRTYNGDLVIEWPRHLVRDINWVNEAGDILPRPVPEESRMDFVLDGDDEFTYF